MRLYLKTYRYYKCVKCKKPTKKEQVSNELRLGNPFYTCGHCGQLNYDPYILEAALINPEKLIKEGQKKYNELQTILCLGMFVLGAPFISELLECLVSFQLMDCLMQLVVIGLMVGIYRVLNGIIKKKKAQVTLEQYREVINASICRLETNAEYAKQVIHLQGNDVESEWSKRNSVYSNNLAMQSGDGVQMEQEEQKVLQTPKKNSVKPMLILGIILCIAGICVMILPTSSEKPVNIHTINVNEIESGNRYFINELYIGDEYATKYEDEFLLGEKISTNITREYYVAVFADKENRMCIASLEVGPHGDLSEQLEAYIEDKTKSIGDFVLSGYFDVGNMEKELREALDEVVSIYHKELASIDNSVFEPVYVNFDYMWEGDYEDYLVDGENDKFFNVFQGILCCMIGLLLVILSMRRAKKEKLADRVKCEL